MRTSLATFRFQPGTLHEIDAIAEHLLAQGHGDSRAEAVRWAVRQAYLRLPGGEKEFQNKSKKKRNVP